jgi:hypothetical protein
MLREAKQKTKTTLLKRAQIIYNRLLIKKNI